MNASSVENKSKMKLVRNHTLLGVFALMALGTTNALAQKPINVGTSTDAIEAPGSRDASKLSPELEITLREKTGSRSPLAIPPRFGDKLLKSLYGIEPGQSDPLVNLSVELRPGGSTAFLQRENMSVFSKFGDIATVRTRLSMVPEIARNSNVTKVSLIQSGQTGARIKRDLPAFAQPQPLGLGLSPQVTTFKLENTGFTGKGVCVGVIDTGIDYNHPDFKNPDGSSRILAIWDPYDESYKTSNKKIGSAPPLEDADGPFGTVYTRDQITAALKSGKKLATEDLIGHGTAVAGIMAGNGAAAGAKKLEYQGLAPQADIIVVRAGYDGGLIGLWTEFSDWIYKQAQAVKKPVAINISAGSQFNGNDGREPQERSLDAFLKDKPGCAVFVSAGNERQDQITAITRFNSKLKGRAGNFGVPINVVSEVGEPTANNNQMPALLAYFDRNDEWGFYITGPQAPYLNKDGVAAAMHCYVEGGKVYTAFNTNNGLTDDERKKLASMISIYRDPQGLDRVTVSIPKGTYKCVAYGRGEKVSKGVCIFKLPFSYDTYISKGALMRYQVGSPANANSVIAVGAYNFRNSWVNAEGTDVNYNVEVGDLADYSSAGYRRDGVVKPDISAPGTYHLSPAAAGSEMAMDAASMGYRTVKDGPYIAWEGTSASCPFAAAVGALMLEKNPSQTAAQIREAMIKTAKTDNFTGACPNPEWGYGKVNPTAALNAVKVPTAKPAK